MKVPPVNAEQNKHRGGLKPSHGTQDVENYNQEECYPQAPHVPLKGRGALTNPANRFYTQASETIEDGWWQETEDADVRKIKTIFIEEQCRSIISTNASPDIPFDKSINPYRGCEHGCIYCYARPSHAYWDMSPGLDFETRIITKPNAAKLLTKTLSQPNYQCSTINIGANTDPYQPIEAQLKTTRSLLKVLQSFNHPVGLITKGALIIRDIDILAEMASKSLASVAISVTTLDDELKRKLEPRTASGRTRLRVIKALSEAGIPVTMMVAPVIPMINDCELEDILDAGKQAGATSVQMIFLRLPREVSPMFRDWLEVHYPDRADHVMSLIQQSRQGKDYQSGFFRRMAGEGVFAELIRKRFDLRVKKLGLNQKQRFQLNTRLFKRVNQQLSLF